MGELLCRRQFEPEFVQLFVLPWCSCCKVMKMCENDDHVMSRCREGYVKVDTHTDIQAQTYTHSQFDEEELVGECW